MDIETLIKENNELKLLVNELQENFNPDSYIDSTNKTITSCWGITPKTGIMKIRDKKEKEWNNRLDILKQQIEYWCNEDNKTEKTIEVIQLFYDEIINKEEKEDN